MNKKLMQVVLLLILFFPSCKDKETIMHITGISITKDSITVEVGAPEQLDLIFTPVNATNRNTSWISSNQNIATVSSAGLVIGISSGTADIIVTTEDGGFTDSCKVKVNIPAEPVQFTMTIGPDGGTIIEPRGTTISIPPGALSQNTEISVTTLLNSDEISELHGANPFLAGVELLPDGTTFAQPVTVTVPLEEPLLTDSTYDIFIFDQQSSQWKPSLIGIVNESGNNITFQTDHFSVLSIGPWFSGSLDMFPRALGYADCMAELAFSNFINTFVNNHGTHLFDMKKIIGGVTYNVCGVNFDFQHNCDQDKGKNTRLLGNSSGIYTCLSDSADIVSNGHSVITNLKVTIYWAIWSNPEFQSIFICDGIPRTPNDPQNFNYYSTLISIPLQLPESGNFYFSTTPNSVSDASIQGYICLNNVITDAFDLSLIPRESIVSYKGSSIAVNLWAYKSLVYHENSAIWIVWGP